MAAFPSLIDSRSSFRLRTPSWSVQSFNGPGETRLPRLPGILRPTKRQRGMPHPENLPQRLVVTAPFSSHGRGHASDEYATSAELAGQSHDRLNAG